MKNVATEASFFLLLYNADLDVKTNAVICYNRDFYKRFFTICNLKKSGFGCKQNESNALHGQRALNYDIDILMYAKNNNFWSSVNLNLIYLLQINNLPPTTLILIGRKTILWRHRDVIRRKTMFQPRWGCWRQRKLCDVIKLLDGIRTRIFLLRKKEIEEYFCQPPSASHLVCCSALCCCCYCWGGRGRASNCSSRWKCRRLTAAASRRRPTPAEESAKPPGRHSTGNRRFNQHLQVGFYYFLERNIGVKAAYIISTKLFLGRHFTSILLAAFFCAKVLCATK